MRWSIRNQILVPVAATMVVAVVTIAVSSAYLAAERSEAQRKAHLAQVVETLHSTRFPITGQILVKMKGLSGAEIIAVDRRGQFEAASFLSPDGLQQFVDQVDLAEGSAVGQAETPMSFRGSDWWVSAVDRDPASGRSLIVLFPDEARRDIFWSSARPPLIIGGVTLVFMLLVSVWLASRFSRRLSVVRGLFSQLESGTFPQARLPSVHDELRDLIESANHLSKRLEQLQNDMQRTDRLRLLAQLSSGLAHQLRNSLTGAKLAIQIHQRRHGRSADESLDRALRELSWTEQQVQRLLAVGGRDRRDATTGSLKDVLDDVSVFIQQQCEHSGVGWNSQVSIDSTLVVTDAVGLRMALLNLLLNASEAAGAGGDIGLLAEQIEGAVGDPQLERRVRIEVSDSGPGPSAEVRDRLFEPFVSSKEGGIGVGLMSARTVIQEMDGTLRWERRDERTVFEIVIPPLTGVNSASSSGPTDSGSSAETEAAAAGDIA